MKLKDVRLGAVPTGKGTVSIREMESGNFIGELWPIPGLNKRQLRVLANEMCNAFNANQIYGPLEKKKKL